jgi:polyribonucleotide nucleotidyltransferase
MHRVTLKIGEEELALETGRMAKQANGSIFATYGDSSVLATVCCGSKPVEDLDYVPLSVDYNEKYYAAGKIPGGFLKREGRPKDKEILVSRLIDRPMRPLFSKSFKREIQLVPTTISTDNINPPDVVGMVAASAAVMVSDIPFDGPVGAVRVSLVEGEYVVNPTFAQVEVSDLDIIVAGTLEGITMVEGGAKMVSEEQMIEAIEKARPVITDICNLQIELRKLAGKEKLPLVESVEEFALKDEIWNKAFPKMEEACFVIGKFERKHAINKVIDEIASEYADRIADEDKKKFHGLFEEMEQKILRTSIVEKGVRVDGRSPVDIRPITVEKDVLPRVHGSALFTRGETQALAVTTLGTVRDEQIMDTIDGDRREHFLLHYNFPPFSVGETGRLGTGRREIGHGHLAHRALEAVLPQKADFPYTIRIVSEVLESNGSSSMATVCGGSLSLLNAGIPVKKPVAGIAMGMIQEGDKSVILSDILGEEDHLGDMDFKVAGTEDGITAFQMDIKVSNVSPEIMKTALAQAKEGRMHILGIMNELISEPEADLSEFAPRIISFTVDQDDIGALIGPGGKVIKGVNEKFGVETNIENDGTVTIYSTDAASAREAKASFLSLLEEPEIGKIYPGVVRRIVDFGAFIEFLPGKEGLCHISKMSKERINKVEDVLELGQQVDIKIIEIDKMGRVNLTTLVDEDVRPRSADRPPRSDRDRGGRGGDRHSRGGDRGGDRHRR